MHRFFISLYYIIKKNRKLSLLIALMVFCCGIFFASKINFNEDISQIIPKSDKSNITAKVLKQMNFSDKIVVIIENKSKENGYQLSETAEEFLQKTEPLQKEFIRNVEGKINEDQINETFDFVQQNLPIFLDDEDYKTLENRINKDSITQRLENNYQSLVSPTS